MISSVTIDPFDSEVFKSKQEILDFVDSNPDLTYDEIAEELEISEYLIRRMLGLIQ